MMNVSRAAFLAAAVLSLFRANAAAAAAPAQNKQQELSRELVALVRSGSPRVARVRALLDNGANVNARDADAGSRATVLSWACYSNGYDVAALLLERGADPNAPDANGQTPLATAAVFGDVRLVRRLLARGARLARPDGGTVLINACEAVNLPVAYHLLALRPTPSLNSVAVGGRFARAARLVPGFVLSERTDAALARLLDEELHPAWREVPVCTDGWGHINGCCLPNAMRCATREAAKKALSKRSTPPGGAAPVGTCPSFRRRVVAHCR